MASYSIRDLEKLSGIKAHTLRIWEKRFNLLDPKRTPTNIRYYDDEDLKRIMNIALLNRKGFKISHIALLDKTEILNQISRLSKTESDTETLIDSLVLSMIELDEKRFEKIVNTSVMQIGFEETFMKAIYPFFEKVGILWQTGSVKPAQEHFVSNLIRQKLIVAIDGVIDPDIPSSKSYLLFTPEGEFHEIGLLFYYYLIKKTGHKAVYLGSSVPFSDLAPVLEIRQCNHLVFSISSMIGGININSYIKALTENFQNKKILMSVFKGGFTEENCPAGVIMIKSPEHFRELLTNNSGQD